MALGIKYRLEYKSRGNYDTKIDVLVEGYSGAIIELIGSANPFELVYESSSDNQFAIWKNSYCVLNVKLTPTIKSDFIEIENEDNFILKYYRNNNLEWSGYLLQEQYYEGDDNNNPFISIKFYDAISRLRVYTINDTTLNTSAYTYSLSEIFSQVNSLLYTRLGGNGFLLNNFLTNTINTANNLFDIVYIQRRTFFDKDNNAYNLYDVLEKIANSFNLTYLLYKNELAVHNFEYSKNPKFVDFGNGKTILSVNNHTTLSNNIFWINKSKGLYFWDSMKKMEVFHKFVEEPNYIYTGGLSTISKLREYVTEPSPIVSNTDIKFLTYADLAYTRGGTDPARSYKDVSVTNSTPVTIVNNDLSKYRFSFNLRFEIDYGVTDAEYSALTDTQKAQLEEDIKQIEANTELRLYYQIKAINGGVTYYLNTGRTGNSTYDTFERNIELNSSRGLEAIGIDKMIEGYKYEVDIPTRAGTNQYYFKFYQPYVYTNVANLSSTNTRRIEGVNVIISTVSLQKIANIGLEEIRYEGITDRNVFNYNLNRDKEYYYMNIEEGNYKYNISYSNNTIIPTNTFRKRSRDYATVLATGYDVYSFLLNQSLEQYGFQQQYITGDLMVRNNSNFNIFSTLTIGSKDLGIIKYNYNDKSGVYSIEFLEIK